MLGAKIRSVLLVDFDNIDGNVGRAFGEKIENWTAWIEEGAFSKRRRPRKLVAKRVYWNGRTDRHRAAFEQEGYEAFACRPAAANKIKENKSSADIVIAIDAMDLMHEHRIKEVILLTADTDFVPLVNRLQLKNLSVVVVGNEADPSSAIFRERAEEVISVGALRDACSFAPARPRKRAAAKAIAPPPAAASPAPAPNSRARGPRRTKRQQTEFDLKQAAALVAELAMQTPNRAVSRKAIETALARMPGFTKTSTAAHAAWLGCGNFQGMVKALAGQRAGLNVSRTRNGGWQIKFDGELPDAT